MAAIESLSSCVLQPNCQPPPPAAHAPNPKRVIRRSEFPRRFVFIEEEEIREAPNFQLPQPADFVYCGPMPSNVLGGSLQCCCTDPATGFYRDGFCRTGPGDFGLHTVCAVMTSEFLEFSVSRGNDLVTPRPEMGFPGPRAGRSLVPMRQPLEGSSRCGNAPPVILEATHASTVEFVSLEDLMAHAADI